MRLKIFSGDSFKNRLKEKFWIFILLAIGFFMVFPVQEFVRLGHWKAMEYSEGMLLKAYRNMWNGSFAYTGLIVTAAAAFFNALDGFWYLYSAPKVDFYHSLPVKRG